MASTGRLHCKSNGFFVICIPERHAMCLRERAALYLNNNDATVAAIAIQIQLNDRVASWWPTSTSTHRKVRL